MNRFTPTRLCGFNIISTRVLFHDNETHDDYIVGFPTPMIAGNWAEDYDYWSRRWSAALAVAAAELPRYAAERSRRG